MDSDGSHIQRASSRRFLERKLAKVRREEAEVLRQREKAAKGQSGATV